MRSLAETLCQAIRLAAGQSRNEHSSVADTLSKLETFLYVLPEQIA
jgi:hypothetical protein